MTRRQQGGLVAYGVLIMFGFVILGRVSVPTSPEVYLSEAPAEASEYVPVGAGVTQITDLPADRLRRLDVRIRTSPSIATKGELRLRLLTASGRVVGRAAIPADLVPISGHVTFRPAIDHDERSRVERIVIVDALRARDVLVGLVAEDIFPDGNLRGRAGRDLDAVVYRYAPEAADRVRIATERIEMRNPGWAHRTPLAIAAMLALVAATAINVALVQWAGKTHGRSAAFALSGATLLVLGGAVVLALFDR